MLMKGAGRVYSQKAIDYILNIRNEERELDLIENHFERPDKSDEREKIKGN